MVPNYAYLQLTCTTFLKKKKAYLYNNEPYDNPSEKIWDRIWDGFLNLQWGFFQTGDALFGIRLISVRGKHI